MQFNTGHADNQPYSTTDNLTFYSETFRQKTIATLKQEKQFGSISLDEWISLLSKPINSFNDLDKLYLSIKKLEGSDVLAFRWNQGLSYINKWVSRPDHKWIAMIRNPMDRACSSQTIWKQDFSDHLSDSIAYYDKLTSLGDRVDAIVYYEDLVTQPIEQIRLLAKTLGIPSRTLKIDSLLHQDGSPYRNESAALVATDGTHKKGRKFEGFYTNRIGIYESEMSAEWISIFKERLSEYLLLERYF